jgi:hypothetical protein
MGVKFTHSVNRFGVTSKRNFEGSTIINKMPDNAGFKGVYTYKRAKRKIINTCKWLLTVQKLGNFKTVHYVLTFPDTYTQQNRVRALRGFIDALRKQIKFYIWITEKHKSGKIHFHVAIVTEKLFVAKRFIQKWSIKYCGSVNGMNVTEHYNDGIYYVIKDIIKTNEQKNLEMNVRLWGSSRVPKYVDIGDIELKNMKIYSNIVSSEYIRMDENEALGYIYKQLKKRGLL